MSVSNMMRKDFEFHIFCSVYNVVSGCLLLLPPIASTTAYRLGLHDGLFILATIVKLPIERHGREGDLFLAYSC